MTVLCGLVNDGDTKLNVSGIAGSVNTADLRYNLQNLTGIRYDMIVEPHDEMTFEYKFLARENREGVKANIMLAIYYHDSTQESAKVFFNETVEFVEPDDGLDTKLLMTYMIAAVVVALMGYLGFSLLKGISSKKPIETGTQSGGLPGGDDWLSNYNEPIKGKARRRKA